MARNRGPREQVRLQKFLSDAGIASRRDAEQLIIDGRVLVNGAVVDTLPAFVDVEQDRVLVDGHRVRPARTVYAILHKPAGVVVAERDPVGRRRVADLLPPVFGRVLPVGRMDAEASGVLLLTNDGDLTAALTHSRVALTSEYQVEVKGQATPQVAGQLRRGVYLAEGKATVVAAEVRHTTRERSVVWVELRERINRQIRRMMAHLGFPVRKLHRLAYGPLRVKGLPVGASRELSDAELVALREVAARRDHAQPRLRHAPRGKPRPAVVDEAVGTAPAEDRGAPAAQPGRPPRNGRPGPRKATAGAPRKADGARKAGKRPGGLGPGPQKPTRRVIS